MWFSQWSMFTDKVQRLHYTLIEWKNIIIKIYKRIEIDKLSLNLIIINK